MYKEVMVRIKSGGYSFDSAIKGRVVKAEESNNIFRVCTDELVKGITDTKAIGELYIQPHWHFRLDEVEVVTDENDN